MYSELQQRLSFHQCHFKLYSLLLVTVWLHWILKLFLQWLHRQVNMHRWWKVEKLGEYCYLRELSLSRGVSGHAPQEIFEKYCQKIEFVGI